MSCMKWIFMIGRGKNIGTSCVSSQKLGVDDRNRWPLAGSVAVKGRGHPLAITHGNGQAL